MKGSSIGTIAAVIAALAGCAEALAPHKGVITLETDRSTYQSTDTIALLLVNSSDFGAGYNLCTAELETQRDLQWIRVPRREANIPCLAALWNLDPSEIAVEMQPVRSWMEPGSYRFSAMVRWPLDGDSVEFITSTFQVE
jgi:hypothetical protein